MFYIIFGSFWTLISGVMIWGFYFSGMGTVIVNGQPVSQAEFNTIAWPKIMLGVFLVIGLICIIIGLKQIIRNLKTEKMGEKCFGKLLDVYRSGVHINDRPEYKAEFAVYVPSLNSVQIISEVIGMNRYDFAEGAFFDIKFFNGDINVGKMVNDSEVPTYINEMINEKLSINDKKQDIIEINGEKYVKIDD